jgi:hypothetical protein
MTGQFRRFGRIWRGNLGLFWIVWQLRLFLSVEMIEIAVELVEAMHRGQELVGVESLRSNFQHQPTFTFEQPAYMTLS